MFLHSFLYRGEHLFFTFSYIWNLELVEVGFHRNSCTMILPQKVGCLISILRAFWHAVMNDWHQSQRAKKDSACCDVSDLSWSKHGRCRLCTLMHISNCIINCQCIVVLSLNWISYCNDHCHCVLITILQSRCGRVVHICSSLVSLVFCNALRYKVSALTLRIFFFIMCFSFITKD